MRRVVQIISEMYKGFQAAGQHLANIFLAVLLTLAEEVELAAAGKVIHGFMGWFSILTVFLGNLSNGEIWLLLTETCRA